MREFNKEAESMTVYVSYWLLIILRRALRLFLNGGRGGLFSWKIPVNCG